MAPHGAVGVVVPKGQKFIRAASFGTRRDLCARDYLVGNCKQALSIALVGARTPIPSPEMEIIILIVARPLGCI